MSKPKINTTTIALVIITLALLVAIPIFLFILHEFRICGKIFCGENMLGIRMAIMLYASDFDGKYPEPDKWCDLLVQYEDVSKKQFLCLDKHHKGGSLYSNYAINPNCNPNCPNDVVLMFETKDGWNQHGGSELLTFDNHREKGANIVFKDGHLEFVKPYEIGKLKWKAEDSNSI